MRRHTKGAAGIALTLLVLTGAGACGGDSGSSAGGSGDVAYVDGATLTAAVTSDPGPLDPHKTILNTAIFLNSLTYDTLARVDAGGALRPGVATRWTVSPTKVTFTLRDDVTCADGSRLTPDVVARNLRYVQDPKNKSPLLGIYLPPGSTTTNDSATVTLTSPAPSAYLAEGAAQVPLVCAAGLADRSTLQRGSAGSGAFVLSEAVPNDHYTFTPRKGYTWGPRGAGTEAPGFPAGLVAKVVQSETTQANLLLSGQIQIVALGGADRARLDRQRGLQRVDAIGSMTSLLFNQNSGHPGADPAVRKALLQATDAGQVADVLLDRRGAPSEGLTVPPSACRDRSVLDARPAFDLGAAKAALDAAGWQPGPDGVRAKAGKRLALTVTYPSALGSGTAGMELLAQQWKAAGADIKLRSETTTAYAQTLFGTGNWDATLLAIGAGSPAVMAPFLSGPGPAAGGQNVAGIDNAAYAAQAAKALATPGEAGCRSWKDGERALFAAGDVYPLAAVTVTLYGKGARFTLDAGTGALEPTSLRATR